MLAQAGLKNHIAVFKVENNVALAFAVELVAVHTDARRNGEFHIDVVVGEFHGVVARFGDFGIVREMRRILLVVGRELSAHRHKQHIAVVGTASSAEVGMRETVNFGIGVMVSTATVPAVETGIGAKLNHTERHNCTREGVTVFGGSHHRVYIFHKIFFWQFEAFSLLAARNHKASH